MRRAWFGAAAGRRASGDWVVVDGVRLQRQRTRVDCGPRALAMVVQRWGLDEAPALAIDPGRRGRRQDSSVIRAGAWSQGFRLRRALDDLNYEIDHARPVLLGLVRKDGRNVWSHYVVLVGHDRGGARWLVADPDTGWRVVTQKDLPGTGLRQARSCCDISARGPAHLRRRWRFVAFQKMPMESAGVSLYQWISRRPSMWKTDALRSFARQSMARSLLARKMIVAR